MGSKFIIGDQELYVGNMSGRKKPVIMIKEQGCTNRYTILGSFIGQEQAEDFADYLLAMIIKYRGGNENVDK